MIQICPCIAYRKGDRYQMGDAFNAFISVVLHRCEGEELNKDKKETLRAMNYTTRATLGDHACTCVSLQSVLK